MTTAWKLRGNGVFGGFNFFKKVYGTSSVIALFHENFSCAEIRQPPDSSTGTHAGKFSVFLIGNRAHYELIIVRLCLFNTPAI
jgi:hypothetical protein